MSVVNMQKTIKEVHNDYVCLYKVGAFYHAYEKDAILMSYLFGYYIKTVQNNISMIGFPKDSINKVMSKLENKKINYVLIDVKNNYDEDEKIDNGNLNTYNDIFEKAHKYIKIKRRIDKICENLTYEIEKENIKDKLRRIEEIIDES